MAVDSKQSYSQADLNALMNQALEENGAVIIKRPGRGDLAIIPAEKLRQLDTTDYLLASAKNRKRLTTALRDARAGKGHRLTIRQLRKQVGLSD